MLSLWTIVNINLYLSLAVAEPLCDQYLLNKQAFIKYKKNAKGSEGWASPQPDHFVGEGHQKYKPKLSPCEFYLFLTQQNLHFFAILTALDFQVYF